MAGGGYGRGDFKKVASDGIFKRCNCVTCFLDICASHGCRERRVRTSTERSRQPHERSRHQHPLIELIVSLRGQRGLVRYAVLPSASFNGKRFGNGKPSREIRTPTRPGNQAIGRTLVADFPDSIVLHATTPPSAEGENVS